MGASYGECLKAHAHLGGKIDGCQEFKACRSDDGKCAICGCHENYHKKVVRVTIEVVYTECHKIHNLDGSYTKDGYKEFSGDKRNSYVCAACKCHKSFHRNEVTKEVKTESFYIHEFESLG